MHAAIHVIFFDVSFITIQRFCVFSWWVGQTKDQRWCWLVSSTVFLSSDPSMPTHVHPDITPSHEKSFVVFILIPTTAAAHSSYCSFGIHSSYCSSLLACIPVIVLLFWHVLLCGGVFVLTLSKEKDWNREPNVFFWCNPTSRVECLVHFTSCAVLLRMGWMLRLVLLSPATQRRQCPTRSSVIRQQGIWNPPKFSGWQFPTVGLWLW